MAQRQEEQAAHNLEFDQGVELVPFLELGLTELDKDSVVVKYFVELYKYFAIVKVLALVQKDIDFLVVFLVVLEVDTLNKNN